MKYWNSLYIVTEIDKIQKNNIWGRNARKFQMKLEQEHPNFGSQNLFRILTAGTITKHNSCSTFDVAHHKVPIESKVIRVLLTILSKTSYILFPTTYSFFSQPPFLFSRNRSSYKAQKLNYKLYRWWKMGRGGCFWHSSSKSGGTGRLVEDLGKARFRATL